MPRSHQRSDVGEGGDGGCMVVFGELGWSRGVAAERIAADVRIWAEGGGLGGHHASDCAPDTSVATFTPRSSPFDQK